MVDNSCCRHLSLLLYLALRHHALRALQISHLVPQRPVVSTRRPGAKTQRQVLSFLFAALDFTS